MEQQGLFTQVHFRAYFKTDFGEKVRVVGNHANIGNWDPAHGHELITTDELYPSWFSHEPVALPLRGQIEYKYVIVDYQGNLVKWEELTGGNRTLSPSGVEQTVEDDEGFFRAQTSSKYGITLDATEGLAGEDSEDEEGDEGDESPAVHKSSGNQEEAADGDGAVSLAPAPSTPLNEASRQTSRRRSDTGELTRQMIEQERALKLEGARHEEELRDLLSPNDSLWVVAYELPVGVVKDEKTGKFALRQKKSLLMPSLHAIRNDLIVPVKFVGYPGLWVESEEERAQIAQLLEPQGCIPVWPSKAHKEAFLFFCQAVLWPLFHNVLFRSDQSTEPFSYAKWHSYQAINREWAEAVVERAADDDVVWVHDYHLMLVPMFITRKSRLANVGFFLHSPFPSSEIFRNLPVREEIIKAMLCADLVGFHFFEYARHFMVTCKRLLGLSHHFRRGGFVGIEYLGRSVMIRIGHVPLSFSELRSCVSGSEDVRERTRRLREEVEGRFIFGSVDRCDSLAGVFLKLQAFEAFLDDYPYAQGRCVLVQLVYPFLNMHEDTESIQRDLTEKAQRLNNKYSQLARGRASVILEFAEIEREQKWALFEASDCLVDTSVRDGLNLNPFEFICCKAAAEADSQTGEGEEKGQGTAGTDTTGGGVVGDTGQQEQQQQLKLEKPGFMILSEFSGSSRVLASAMRVNPWKSDAVAQMMDRALKADPREIAELLPKYQRDKAYLQRGSTSRWVEEFLHDLRRGRRKDGSVFVTWGVGQTGYKLLGVDAHFRKLELSAVVQAYRVAATLRVLFFDHEGTLAPDKRRFTSHIQQLTARGSPPSELVMRCLAALCRDPKNVVVILSGREKSYLDEWFAGIPNLGLCAEHGFYCKVPALSGDKWEAMSSSVDFRWKDLAMEMMTQYAKRCQGAYVENKGSALVWQYRDADPDFGSWQAKELESSLSQLLVGHPVSIISGKGYVEAKLRGINKGTAIQKVLDRLVPDSGSVDFLLCIGDDRSDEDMFQVVSDIRKAAGDRDEEPPDVAFSGLGAATSTAKGTQRVNLTPVRTDFLRSPSPPDTSPTAAEPPPLDRSFTEGEGRFPPEPPEAASSPHADADAVPSAAAGDIEGIGTSTPAVRVTYADAPPNAAADSHAEANGRPTAVHRGNPTLVSSLTDEHPAGRGARRGLDGGSGTFDSSSATSASAAAAVKQQPRQRHGSITMLTGGSGRNRVAFIDTLQYIQAKLKSFQKYESYFAVTVGQKPSHARYYLDSVEEVSELLEALELWQTKKQVPVLGGSVAATSFTLPTGMGTKGPPSKGVAGLFSELPTLTEEGQDN